MSEFQNFVDKLMGGDQVLMRARKYRMTRPIVQIPRMTIRADIIRPAGESTEAQDQRPLTFEVLELNATTKLDSEDIEASRKLVIEAVNKAISEAASNDGAIPFKTQHVRTVRIGEDRYRVPMNNLIIGVHLNEETGEFFFDAMVQDPKAIVKL